jgi:hypothetical protein
MMRNVTNEIGSADAAEVATAMGADVERATLALEALSRRRLVMRVDGRYVAVGNATG